MLRDKGKKKIEEIKADFNPDGFNEEKITNIFNAVTTSMLLLLTSLTRKCLKRIN